MASKFLPFNELHQAGYHTLTRVPFLIDGDGLYCSIQNRFLREIATGRYTVGQASTIGATSPTRLLKRSSLSDLTLNTYADDLTNFQTWCDTGEMHANGHPIKFAHVEEHTLEGYAQDMEIGAWSRDGVPLQKATIIRRLSTNLQCVEFAIFRGLRPAVTLNKVESSYRSASGGTNARDGQVRTRENFAILAGRRPDPKHITLPSLRQLGQFVGLIRDPAARIAIELILNGGLRVSEVGMLANTGPHALATSEQILAQHGTLDVDVPLRVLGKGQKWRTTYIPGQLLRDIDLYRNNFRSARIPTYAEDPGSLLLSQRGLPLSKKAISDAWSLACRAMRHLGHALPGFSPHVGRHAFAVYWLQARIRDEAHKRQVLPDRLPEDIILAAGQTHLLRLKGMLGHTLLSTTERYLVLLPSLLRLGSTTIAYHALQDEDV